ncbi:MAG: hypothetical protein EXS05_15880 [Planctomycetaceae bacterium]|nr:hypothetical protein [Planctomycetaceae bacterium]
MFTLPWLFDWLILSAATSLLLLTLGSLAVLCCRQPVRRMRIIVWTLSGCLVAPLISLAPGLPHWTLPVPEANRADESGAAQATAAPPRSFPHTGQDAEPSVVMEPTVAAGDSIAPINSLMPTENGVADVSGPWQRGTIHALERTESPFYTDSPIEVTDAATPADTARLVATTSADSTDSHYFSESSLAADPRRWIVTGYFAGLALLAAWGVVGLAGLRRVLRVAHPAPPWCRSRLHEIAGPAGDRVQILVSPRASQPFTFAGRKPVIVLPAAIVAMKTDIDLRWSLAHEWSHIARGDVWIWSFASLVRLVYYYQPLSWWLRRQLRLCQDYLADAAAARQSSAADYAEFLTTRAAGRPSAVGLGIASGPSDLYRRVSMLLKNPRPLETQCSWTWTAGVAATAALLILLAATFGDRPIHAAADNPAGTTQTEAPEKLEATAPAERAFPKTKKAKTPRKLTQDRERILNLLATRASLFPHGTIEFKRRFWLPNHSSEEIGLVLAVAKEGWVVRPAASPLGEAVEPGVLRPDGRVIRRVNPGEYVMVHDGRCLELRGIVQVQGGAEDGTDAVGGQLRVTSEASIEMRYAEAASNLLERGTPYGTGTIYYESGRRFIEKHAAQARFSGEHKIGSLDVLAIEWDVAPADAADAFPDDNQFLKLGGMLRVHVATQKNDVVRRIEGIDRFGTVQFIADCLLFDTEPVGELYPSVYIQSGGQHTRFNVFRLAKLDEPVAEDEFILDLPVGVRVKDLRPRSKDQFDPNGGFLGINPDEYPLRQFVTTAAYPKGFPAKLLAELDRDVLPWAKAEQALLGNFGGAAPGMGSAGTGRMGMGSMRRSKGAGAGGLGMAGAGAPGMGRGGVVAYDVDLLNEMTNAMRPMSIGIPHSMRSGGGMTGGSPLGGPISGKRAVPPDEEALEKDSGSDAAESTDKPGSSKLDRNKMRYGGKTFEEWQQLLLTDLETESRIKSLKALDAFASNGYAEEAAATIQQALIDDLLQRPNPMLAEFACGTLARSGKTGLPALEQLMTSLDGPTVSITCQTFATILAANADAVPSVLTIIQQDAPAVPYDLGPFFFVLARQYLDQPGVAETLNNRIDNRYTPALSDMLNGLGVSKAPAETVVPLLLKAMTVDSSQVKQAAALILAGRTPESDSTIETITKYLDECDAKTRLDFFNKLRTGRYKANPRIAIPILIAGFDKPDWFVVSPEMLLAAMIDSISSFGSHAESAVPVLLKALRNELPTQDYNLQLHAAGALGNIGPAAAEAVPLLNELLNKPPDFSALGGSGPEQALEEWRNRLRTAIRKIEAK